MIPFSATGRILPWAIGLLTLLALATLTAACGKSPAFIELRPDRMTLDGAGATATVQVELRDAKRKKIRTSKKVEWSSSDERVATVTDGVVAAGEPGTANITARVGRIERSVRVVVRSPEMIAAEAKQKEAEAAARVRREQIKSITAERLRNASLNKSLCDKHPEWSRDECNRIASRQYWVGMDVQMLSAAAQGPPTVTRNFPKNGRPSTRWCWPDIKPSCFYDFNGDNKIDTWD
jgi:hypothetical protein